MLRFIKFGYGGFLIITPDKKAIFWDTGRVKRNRSTYDYENDEITKQEYSTYDALNYCIYELNINEVYVCITHWHYSTHTKGLKYILNNPLVKVKGVYTSGVYSTRNFDDEWKDECLEIIERKEVPLNFRKAGDNIEIGDITIKILAPHSDITEDETQPGSYTGNANQVGGMVGRIEYYNNSILLPGDRGDRAYSGDWNPLSDALELADTEIKSTILHGPHHGIYLDLSDKILNLVEPEVLVLSHHPAAQNSISIANENNINTFLNMGEQSVDYNFDYPAEIQMTDDGYNLVESNLNFFSRRDYILPYRQYE